jgi:N-dimethylarginine dimethylaminohydrolase
LICNVIGKHIIETNLRMMFRCKEHFGYEQLFRARLMKDPDARHVRMPDTTPILSGETEDEFLNDPRPFLEGGDTFVLGKDILVGFSSLGSSPAGAAWLQRYLEPDGYRVHLVPLTTEWLHLDCMFAIVREGLCMCFTGGLKDGQLPGPVKDWEIIEATAEEAHTLGCNTICLEPGVVIIGAEHKRLIREIEKRGVQIVPVPSTSPRSSAAASAARRTRCFGKREGAGGRMLAINRITYRRRHLFGDGGRAGTVQTLSYSAEMSLLV